MPKKHIMSWDKTLTAPLKMVKHFFLEFYEHRDIDSAMIDVAEDMQFHGLGAPNADLWNKDEIRLELQQIINNKQILRLISFDLTPRLLAQGVCIVSGSMTLGEGSDTLLLEMCVVAVCRETEDGWKIIQLHTYFPWKENGYHYDDIFTIQKDYASRLQKEFWKSNLPSGLFTCHNQPPFCLVAMNDSLLRQLGFQSQLEFQEYSGISIMNAIHPDDISRFMELRPKLQEGSEEQAITCRIRRKDFAFAWFVLRGRAMKDDECGDILICSCNEIKEEWQEAMHQERMDTEDSANELGLILENIPGGSYRCRLFGDEKLDFVSDGFCRLSGFSYQEIQTQFHSEFTRLIYEGDREKYELVLQRLQEYMHTATVQYRLRCQDGSLRWVMDTLRSVRHDNRTMWVYGLITDIDKDHLRESELERFLNAAPSGLAVVSLQNGVDLIRQCNTTLLQMLECTKGELLGQNFGQFIEETDVPVYRQCIERLRSGALSESCRVTLGGIERPREVLVLANAQEHVADRLTICLALTETSDLQEKALPEDDHQRIAPQVSIRTFDYFDVFVDGKPIPFRSAKAKELLALLVDRGGGYVSAAEIISCLWENETANKVTLARCRKVAMRLTDKLREYGVEDIVESVNGSRRVVPSRISCDLYDYLDQKPGAEHLFKGTYLANYSWGEMRLSSLMAEAEV